MWVAGPALQAGGADSVDPYGRCVTLLIDPVGENNSKSIVDLSPNNGTPALYGDTKLSTAVVKAGTYGNASLYFDGTGDCLAIGELNSAFTFGASDFTIEGWFYLTSIAASATLSCKRNASADYSPWLLVFDQPSGQIKLYASTSGTGWTIGPIGSVSVSANTWFHVAVVRYGSVISLYVNGTLSGTAGLSAALMSNSAPFCISGTPDGNFALTGYVAGVRVTKGVARYSGSDAFTPPTALRPLRDKLRRKDLARVLFNLDSTNDAHDVVNGVRFVRAGNAAISTTQRRHGGAALYLDGTGDYLVGPAYSTFNFGTQKFTAELWVYFNALPNSGAGYAEDRVDTLLSTYDGAGKGWILQYRRDTTDRFQFSVGDTSIVTSHSFTPATSRWYHVAATRDGDNFALFVDGACVGTASSSVDIVNGRPVSIGALYASGYIQTPNAYIDDVRITLGAARYVYAGAPVSAPTKDGYTTSVLNFDGNLTDEHSLTWTANGNAAVSVTQAKFGTHSLALDGTGDYLSLAANGALGFAAADFTVEAWIYPTALSGADKGIIDFRGLGPTGGTLFLDSTASFKLAFWDNTSKFGAIGTAPALNTWSHVAAVRRDGMLFLLLNGAVQWMGAHTKDLSGTNLCGIGGCPNSDIGLGGSAFTGYIDAVRLSKTARYVLPLAQASLTSTDRFYSYVISHIPGNGGNGLSYIADDRGLTVTNTSVTTSTTQGRFDGSSLSFNGSTSRLDVSNAALATGTGDFTWEAWVYSSSTGAWSRIVETSPYDSANKGWHLSFNGTDAGGSRRLGIQLAKAGGGGARLESDLAFPNTSWAHVAVVRQNNVGRLFIDGFPQTTTLDLSAEDWQQPLVRLGATTAGTPTSFFTGYLADIRFTKGVARYTPTMYMTSEPTALELCDVSVLNCNGEDNSTTLTDLNSANTWTCVADAKLKTAQYKFGSASLYFDGTGDWAWTASNSRFDLGTSDFTIESWIYITSLAAARSLWARRNGTTGASGWAVVVATNGAMNMRALIGGQWRDGNLATPAGSITTNTWHHVSVNRRGSLFFIAIDGVIRGRYTDSGAMSDEASKLMLGVNTENTLENPLVGYIDSFRMTVGRCRYLPPIAPHPRRYGK